jgi:L-ascorbate metabolism protein UlaG (beta-lactamase superfamily)
MTPQLDGTLTWLGHATFCLDTGGKRVLLEAFTKSCPTCPEEWHAPENVDAILLTHAHADHVADVADLARGGATVACMIDLAEGWVKRQGIADDKLVSFNKGGTVEVAGLKVTMVNAHHSSTAPDGSAAGEPAGFVIELANGYRIYHAGDTNVFGDMSLIGELYRPDLALLPIGGHYTMDPREAAKAVELLGVREVVPMHYGTWPVLAGTPDELRSLVGDGVTVHALQPGESLGALATA